MLPTRKALLLNRMQELSRKLAQLCIPGVLAGLLLLLPIASPAVDTGSSNSPRAIKLVKMMAYAPERTTYWGVKAVNLEAEPSVRKAGLREYHKPEGNWRFEY